MENGTAGGPGSGPVSGAVGGTVSGTVSGAGSAKRLRQRGKELLTKKKQADQIRSQFVRRRPGVLAARRHLLGDQQGATLLQVVKADASAAGRCTPNNFRGRNHNPVKIIKLEAVPPGLPHRRGLMLGR